jgi:hypothetical protein
LLKVTAVLAAFWLATVGVVSVSAVTFATITGDPMGLVLGILFGEFILCMGLARAVDRKNWIKSGLWLALSIVVAGVVAIVFVQNFSRGQPVHNYELRRTTTYLYKWIERYSLATSCLRGDRFGAGSRPMVIGSY